MPSLANTYKSSSKDEKGKIISELYGLTLIPYPTLRRKILSGSFSFAEKEKIAKSRRSNIDELFPELINN